MGGLFGDGETIISVSVADVRVSDPNLYHRIKLDSVTKYMKRNWGATDYLANYAKSGDTQFQTFYNSADDSYIYGLPYAVFRTNAISPEIVEEVVTNYRGPVDFVADSRITTALEDNEWVKYLLQENYDYHYDTDYVKINNNYYQFLNCTYDIDNNQYNVTLKPVSSILTRTYEITEVTIVEGVSTDTKTTTVSTEIDTIIVPSYTVVDKTSTITSTTSTSIIHGSEEGSYQIELVNETSQAVSDTSNYTLTLSSYASGSRYLVVSYSVNDRMYLWIENIINITYSGLTSRYHQSKPIGIYPVIQIRKWNKDINHKDYVNTDIYKTAAYVLHRINMSVDELIKAYNENSDISHVRHAFFLFAIAVNDGHGDNDDDVEGKEIVSQFLWETFNYYEDLLPNVDPLDKVELYIECGDYNVQCLWRYLPPKIEEEVIGSIGTYTHQVREEEYVRKEVIVRHVEYKYPNDNHNNTEWYYKAGWKIVTDYDATIIYKGGYESTGYDAESDTSYTVWHDGDEWLKIMESVPHTYEVLDHGHSVYYAGSDTYGWIEDYPVGDYTVPRNNNPRSWDRYGFTYWDIDLDGGDFQFNGTNSPHRELVMKKQIDATHVKVYRVWIARNNYTISSVDGDDGRADAFLQERSFIVHIPHEIITRMSVIEKTKLMGFAMHMTFFSYQKTHLAWYETAGFMQMIRGVTYFIAAIVTMVSLGSLGPEAFAGLTAMEIAMKIGEMVLIAGATYLALKLISTLVNDVTLKMILSAAVVVAAAYAGGAFDEFNAMSVTSLLEIPATALDIYTKDLQEKMNKTNEALTAYSQAYESRMESFKDVQKSIDSGLSVESAANLATGSTSQDMFTNFAYTLSSSMFFSHATTAYLNIDLCLGGTYDLVSKFYDNCLRIGVLPDGGTEE